MLRAWTDRVPDLEAGAGLEAGDELSVQTGGVEGQRELLWDALKLQLHFGTDFLREARDTQPCQLGNTKPLLQVKH